MTPVAAAAAARAPTRVAHVTPAVRGQSRAWGVFSTISLGGLDLGPARLQRSIVPPVAVGQIAVLVLLLNGCGRSVGHGRGGLRDAGG